jgi:hypothetical protein
MRTMFGIGTPRGFQGHLAALTAVLSTLWGFVYEATAPIRSQTDRPTLLIQWPNAFVACA